MSVSIKDVEMEEVFLSHSYKSRIWCFLPVTVICITSKYVILRISNGTKWIAAKDLNGQRIRLGSRKEWSLGVFEWIDNDLTYLICYKEWFAFGGLYNTAKARLIKYYINFQRPLVPKPWGYDTLDLELDMVKSTALNNFTFQWKYKDQERFNLLVKKRFFTTEEVFNIEKAKEKVKEQFKIFEELIRQSSSIKIKTPNLKNLSQIKDIPLEIKNIVYEKK